MKPIERLKPEILVKLNSIEKVYPYTYREIMDQLSTRDAWTRLDYIVAMDIETYGEIEYIGDAFYSEAEVRAKEHTVNE